MIQLSTISTRNQFGQLLTQLNLTKLGVEIGTHRGEFALLLLSNWSGQLYCIDPYISRYSSKDPAALGNRGFDYKHAITITQSYRNRCCFFLETSEEAVIHFNDNTLDFVYVDGNHEPPHPEEDIKRWYPKLKSGGLLAVHDILCPGEINGGWGQYVFPALYNFTLENKLCMYIINEENGQPWTGYIIKR